MERVVTVTQQKRGLGKECKETPGKWQEQQECNTNIICPTEPPETPDETTDGPDGIGVRNGFGGKQLFINDDTLGKEGVGFKMILSFMNILYSLLLINQANVVLNAFLIDFFLQRPRVDLNTLQLS